MSDRSLTDVAGHVEAKAIWRKYQSQFAGDDAADVKVGISASFTADSLVPMLGASLIKAGIKPRITVGQYNQLHQTCFDRQAQFGAVEPDAIIFLWRIEDVLEREHWRFLKGDAKALIDACEKVDELIAAVAHLRSAFGGMIIVSVPPFPQGSAVDLLDIDNPTNGGLFHRTVLDHCVKGLGRLKQVRLVDLDALQRHFGAQNCFDARKWYLYRQPFTESFLLEMGCLLGRLIMASRIAPKKCVVLDADNTLWGGIVGEDGIDGISIGQDFPGSAYRDLQNYMIYLRSRGVLICIASKNNEGDVWEVFDRHDGMELKREHLAAWRIGWLPKSEGLREIAKELNIGIDSMVFVDDSSFEVEQVREALPEVAVLQVEEEPARILEALKKAKLFDKFEVTEEDSVRSELIRSERERTHLGKRSASPDEFVAMLGLKVELGLARESQIGRIAQLINKTSQFNLTTVRRTTEDVSALVAMPNWRVYALRVSDKFGDYGLVGVAIIEIQRDDIWRIDTLLLSCRVLGRKVETSFLAGLAIEAAAAEAKICHAAFIPTAKNAIAADFLSEGGFTNTGQNSWRGDFGQIPPNLPFIDLVLVPQPS
jgi:FkbH-like protein